MQNKNDTKWGQGNLLVLEFTIGRHGLDGGYEEFIKNKDSYLIVDKETYLELNTENTKIISEDNLWILIQNIY